MRKKIKIAVISSVLVLGLLSAVFALSKLPSYIQRLTVTKFEETLGRKVSFEKMKFNYFTGTVYLNGFKVMEKDEKQVFLSFDSLNINVDPIKFIFRTLYLKEVFLENPNISLYSSKEGRNFDDIVERISSRDKGEELKEPKKFLKRIEVHDITIDKFKIQYNDETIQSDNTFTLRTPKILYENNIFDFSSDIKFSNKSAIALKLALNNSTGDLSGTLNTDGFDLNDGKFIKKKLPELSRVSGKLQGDISFSGNFKEKQYLLEGDAGIDSLSLEDASNIPVLLLKSMRINSATVTYPKIGIKMDKAGIENLDFDGERLKKVLSEKKEDSTEEKKSTELSIGIGNLEIKNSSASYKDYKAKNINLSVNQFKSGKGSSFPITLSFDLNDNLFVSTTSNATLLDDMKTDMDFKGLLALSGNLKSQVKNISVVNTMAKELPYSMNSDSFSLDGTYEFRYPSVKLTIGTKLASLELTGGKDRLNDLNLENISLKNDLYFNIEDKSYLIKGPLDIEKFVLADKKGKEIFAGKISVAISDFGKDKIWLDQLSTEFGELDLSKPLNLTAKKDKKAQFPDVKIAQMKLKGGKVILKDLFADNVVVTGKNVSNEKGSSSIEGSFRLNGATAVSGSGVIKKKAVISNKDTLSNATFEGRVTAPSVNLSKVEELLKDKPYKLKGAATLDSNINYTKGSLITNNKLSLKEVMVSKEGTADELYFKKGDANFQLDIKEKSSVLYNGKFSIESFEGELGDSYKANGDTLKLNLEKASKDRVAISSVILLKPHISIYRKTTEKSEKKESRPEVSIKDFSIRDGNVELLGGKRDYDVKEVKMYMSGFTTSKNKKFSTDFEGILLGSGGFTGNAVCSLVRDWDFSPKSLNLDGKINIENLDLANFNDMISENFPNRVNSGKLFYGGSYDLKSGRIQGKNSITIKGITFGQSTGNYLTLPLDKAVKSLKDKNGDINLNIPISGDFNDPNFSFSKALAQGVRSALIKAAATSTVEAITKTIIPKSQEDVESIYFQYLSENLSAKELSKMDRIAEKMNSEKELRVNFTLFTDSKRERELLRVKSIGLAIFQGDISKIVDSKFDELIEGRIETIKKFFRNKGLEERIQVEISEDSKDYPQATVTYQ